jgi:hypothetical protein
MVFLKIKSQIKSSFFNVILKISKSSQNDLKSDFVKSSIKSLNTLSTIFPRMVNMAGAAWIRDSFKLVDACVIIVLFLFFQRAAPKQR